MTEEKPSVVTPFFTMNQIHLYLSKAFRWRVCSCIRLSFPEGNGIYYLGKDAGLQQCNLEKAL